MLKETYKESVKSPSSVPRLVRKASRHIALSLLSAARGSSSHERFLRLFNMHYVFDDQRAEFENQIKFLKNFGDFINTDNAVAMLQGEIPIDGRYFHLSFDDGLGCVARNAPPILDMYDVPAILFINSSVAGKMVNQTERKLWEQRTNYRQPLRVASWATLSETGLEIGAHTRTHPRLSDISGNKTLINHEITGCKTEIETELNRPCQYFAWPYGRLVDVDQSSLNAIHEAGFKAAFGAYRAPVIPGATSSLMIPRHHLEPHWPLSHTRYFAFGGSENKNTSPSTLHVK